jgi:multidrug efflux pump subunit AcrA (membrane-fusion protein)
MKRRTWWWIVAAVVAAGAVAGGVILLTGGDKAQSDPAYTEVVVERGKVRQTVFGSGTVAAAKEIVVRTQTQGTVTSIGIAEGDGIDPGAELFAVDGNGAYALTGIDVFYRTLTSSSDSGDDVLAVQKTLAALEYYEGDQDGTYGWRTQDAVYAFLEDSGRTATTKAGPDAFCAVGTDSLVLSVEAAVGDVVQNGDTILVLTPQAPMEATIQVNELDISLVYEGQKVELTVDALVDQVFSGTVKRVSAGLVSSGSGTSGASSSGNATSGVVTFPVIVAFDEIVPGLKAGMSVSADIITHEAENVLVLPVTAVMERDGRGMVLVGEVSQNGGEVLPTPLIVELGLSDDSLIEIRDGLSEGALVLVQAASGVTVSTGGSGADMPMIPGAGGFGGERPQGLPAGGQGGPGGGGR